jgi:hypothetical protein
MRELFGDVVVAVVALSSLGAVVALIGSGELLRELGRGSLALDREDDRPPGPPPDSPAGRAEREAEIRQLLQARNERRLRNGRPPLDVDAELARLTASPAGGGAARPDPTLEDEVRRLVEARNARRLRSGRKPLDVEAEVARHLAELDG